MAEDIRSELLKHVSSVEEHYSLQGFSPFNCGGVADYFTIARTAVEVASAVKAAIDLKIPYLVIGSGSRIVFSDGGYPGMIIQNLTDSYGIAADKSQVVVDAGMPLSKLVTILAGQGLGGLTPFFGQEGTVGGALYSDLTVEGQSIISSLRYLTAVMPPARIDKESTINRYKRDWLQKEPGLTRLRLQKETSEVEQAQPVILTAMLQLTSVRADELRDRLQQVGLNPYGRKPKGTVLGPLFASDPKLPIWEMLREVRADKIRVGSLSLDGKSPLYIRSKGGSVRASEVRELIEQVQELISQRYGVVPQTRYQYLGVW